MRRGVLDRKGLGMVSVVKTDLFKKWLHDLKDAQAKSRILVRISRMEDGNFGDVKSVGDGVSEIRVDYGQGYRLYFFQNGSITVILLCGGNKKTQQSDIQRAKEMKNAYKN